MPIERSGVLQPRVDRQQRRYAASPGVGATGPSEVHELPVLVDDVGAEVVEQLPQPTPERQPRCERQVEAHREPGLGQHHCRKPHDPHPVTALPRGRFPVCRGDDEHLVAAGGIPPGEGVRQVRGAADARWVEVVDDDDPHVRPSPRARPDATAPKPPMPRVSCGQATGGWPGPWYGGVRDPSRGFPIEHEEQVRFSASPPPITHSGWPGRALTACCGPLHSSVRRTCATT
jgi:hypothetical protein